MIKKICRLLILALLAVALGACAKIQPSGEPAAPDAAGRAWLEYENSVAKPGPYRIQLSMRYSDNNDSRRVTAIFWGNGTDDAMRLDIMAGVGANIAKIFDEGDHFLLLATGEGRAYFHQGGNKPLLQIGVPMPFGLKTLGSVLTGRYDQAFGLAYTGQVYTSKNGLLAYNLPDKPLGGVLELNQFGQAVRWSETRGRGWSMNIDYDDATPARPRKIEVSHPGGQRAIVLVKEREKVSSPFERENITIKLPPGTELLPLKEFKGSKK